MLLKTGAIDGYAYTNHVVARAGLYRGGQYRGTFLIPLSVPSLLFKNCTVFGTVDTFFALLLSLLGTICGMEFK